MGLFSRRRAAVAETATWYPAGEPEEFTGEDADMDDDGQAVHEEGFWVSEVTFEDTCPVGARIIVSVYVSYFGDEFGGLVYSLGLRYQYTVVADPDWSYIGYEADPAGERYESVWDAQVDAREWAALLAAEDDHSRRLLPTVFDWWGEAFPVGDPG